VQKQELHKIKMLREEKFKLLGKGGTGRGVGYWRRKPG
jgi:hypothetical protein